MNTKVIFSQGFISGTYGILGYRGYNLLKEISIDELSDDLDMYDSYLTNVNPTENSWIFGIGYKNYNKKTYNFTTFSNFFLNLELDGMKYDAYEDLSLGSIYKYSDRFSWTHWSIGAGYGLLTGDRISINADIEYNFLTDVESYAEYELDEFIVPSSNYISFNISIGLSKRTEWGPWGLYYSKPFGKHFINSSYPGINSNQITAEIPGVLCGIGLVIAAVAWAGSDYAGMSSSSSPSIKGCHVYGKIKFVEFGEDYKVKFVPFGEDLKIKYVTFGADSPGEWQVVEFGEDYKVKVVQIGEDFKVKEVSFGEGCN